MEFDANTLGTIGELAVGGLQEGVNHVRALTWQLKGHDITSLVTSADNAASQWIHHRVAGTLPDVIYLDEEIASGPENAARIVADNRRVLLADPVDGSIALVKVASRVRLFGDAVQTCDWIDQFSTTVTMFESGSAVAAAIATARGHLFVASGDEINHGTFALNDSRGQHGPMSRLHPLEPDDRLRIALTGAIEDLPMDVIEVERRRYHLQRLGHFATDLVELICGNAMAFISGREKIWDYAVSLPFAASLPQLRVTSLNGDAIPTSLPAYTSLRIAWEITRK